MEDNEHNKNFDEIDKLIRDRGLRVKTITYCNPCAKFVGGWHVKTTDGRQFGGSNIDELSENIRYCTRFDQ